MPNSKPRSNLGPILMIAVGIVIILGLLLWQILSYNPATAGGSIPSATIDPLSTLPRVSLVDAKQSYDQKTAQFLDVRDADSFAAGHVPGALNIPLASISGRIQELNPNQWIITYCT